MGDRLEENLNLGSQDFPMTKEVVETQPKIRAYMTMKDGGYFFCFCVCVEIGFQ